MASSSSILDSIKTYWNMLSTSQKTIQDIMEMVVPYFRDIPLEHILSKVMSIAFTITKDVISAILDFFNLILEKISTLNVIETFKTWLSYVVKLFTNSFTFIEKAVGFIKPYILYIASFFYIDNEITTRKIFGLLKGFFDTTEITIPIELAWETFFITDVVCFYGCFDEIRKNYEPFKQLVGKLIQKWVKFSKEENSSKFISNDEVHTILKLSEKSENREAWYFLYENSKTDIFEILADCWTEYTLRSVKNIKNTLMFLYTMSQKTCVDWFVSNKYLEPIHKLTQLTQAPITFCDLIDLKEFEHLKGINDYNGFKLPIIQKAFEYEVSCIGSISTKDFTPITRKNTFTHMYDERLGRADVLEILAISKEYSTAISTLNNLKATVEFDTMDINTDTNTSKDVFVSMKREGGIVQQHTNVTNIDFSVKNSDGTRVVQIAPQNINEISQWIFRKLTEKETQTSTSIIDNLIYINTIIKQDHKLYKNLLKKYKNYLIEKIIEKNETVPTLIQAFTDLGSANTSDRPLSSNIRFDTDIKTFLNDNYVIKSCIAAVHWSVVCEYLNTLPIKLDKDVIMNPYEVKMIHTIKLWGENRKNVFRGTVNYLLTNIYERAVYTYQLQLYNNNSADTIFAYAGLAAVAVTMFFFYPRIKGQDFWWSQPGNIGKLLNFLSDLLGKIINQASGTLQIVSWWFGWSEPYDKTLPKIIQQQDLSIIHEYIGFVIFNPEFSLDLFTKTTISMGMLSCIASFITTSILFIKNYVNESKTNSFEKFKNEVNFLYNLTNSDFLNSLKLEKLDNLSFKNNILKISKLTVEYFRLLLGAAALAFVGDFIKNLYEDVKSIGWILIPILIGIVIVGGSYLGLFKMLGCVKTLIQKNPSQPIYKELSRFDDFKQWCEIMLKDINKEITSTITNQTAEFEEKLTNNVNTIKNNLQKFEANFSELKSNDPSDLWFMRYTFHDLYTKFQIIENTNISLKSDEMSEEDFLKTITIADNLGLLSPSSSSQQPKPPLQSKKTGPSFSPPLTHSPLQLTDNSSKSSSLPLQLTDNSSKSSLTFPQKHNPSKITQIKYLTSNSFGD